MSKNHILSQLINDLLGNSLEELRRDIDKSKLLIESITSDLKTLDSLEKLTNDTLKNAIKWNKELMVQNQILLNKQEELAKKQEEVSQYISDILEFSNEETLQQDLETQTPYSEAATLEKEEELYVLRQIRNFYLKHNDFDNCHITIERIKDLRDKI